jgi:NADH:ubiquinone oxidoreductase subunit 2 (subunit N)
VDHPGVLLIVGVTTIIIGVMMALVQHNYKRLLGYHAVSQVGYMVTGFALERPWVLPADCFICSTMPSTKVDCSWLPAGWKGIQADI